MSKCALLLVVSFSAVVASGRRVNKMHVLCIELLYSSVLYQFLFIGFDPIDFRFTHSRTHEQVCLCNSTFPH